MGKSVSEWFPIRVGLCRMCDVTLVVQYLYEWCGKGKIMQECYIVVSVW